MRSALAFVGTALAFALGISSLLWLERSGGSVFWHWRDYWSVAIGVVVMAIGGEILVRPLLNAIEAQIKVNGVCTPFHWTDEANVRKWVALTGRGGGGGWIGRLERLLFFTAVGSVSKDHLGNNIDGMNFLLAKRQWATLGYVSFLMGTLTNGVLAFAAQLVTKL